MSIEEGEDLALGVTGSQQSGRDESLPLRLTHDFNHLQRLDVLVQSRLQMICNVSKSNRTEKQSDYAT